MIQQPFFTSIAAQIMRYGRFCALLHESSPNHGQAKICTTVDRQRFYAWREELAAFWYSLCLQPWAASTGLVVRRNHLYDIGGNGIVVHGHVNAHVHNNVVGFNCRSQSPMRVRGPQTAMVLYSNTAQFLAATPSQMVGNPNL
jgi:hypothetical protein